MEFPWASRSYDLGSDHWPGHVLAELYPRLQRPLAFTAFRSHSDGNLFHEKGSRPLLLGPGSLETAHTWDEQVQLEEVDLAAAIYLGLCLAAPGPRETRLPVEKESPSGEAGLEQVID